LVKELIVKNLSVGYSEIQVLRGVSIDLGSKECIGLFGPNGHGKTTLLRTISGLLKPWSGDITFRQKPIDGLSPQTIVERGMIHVSQGNILFPRMTVVENLKFGAFPKRAWNKRKHNLERVFGLFPKLADRRHQLCRTLSGGERQMLAIGMGLMGNAQVLMLDEPTLGLAPKIRAILSDAIQKIKKEGLPLLLVEQDVDFMLELADHVYLIEGGRVALETTPDGVNDEEVLEMYFGEANILQSVEA
jgi:branched-chain amino acid transport system ATP-binding protein